MVDIHLKHYKMLKQIELANPLSADKLSDEQLEIIDFLMEHNFVVPIHNYDNVKKYMDLFTSPNSGYKITQDGLAQLYMFKSKFYKTKTSLILSIFSTAASIVSTIVAIIALLRP